MDGPPSAPRHPATRTLHGENVVDDFAWMRRVDDPGLLAYLAAENDWTAARQAHLTDLRQALYDELAAVLPDDDASAPWQQGGQVYVDRRRAGQQYLVHTRRPVGSTATGDEQVVLDENELAEGADYLDLGVLEVSPGGGLVAYSVDFDGSEVYTLRVRDLGSGADLADELTGTYYGLAWAADGASFFYTTVDAACRPDTVHHHVLGRPQDEDTVVWHEPDRRFELDITATRSGEYVVLMAASRDTSEMRLVPTADPTRPAVVVQRRENGREYHLDHQRGPDGGRLLLVVDDTGPEFRLVEMPITALEGSARGDHRAAWRELLAHRPEVRVVAVDAFADHLVVTERQGGQLQLRLLDAADRTVRVLRPDGPGETVRLGRNEDYDVPAARVVREGWVRPRTDLDHSFAEGAETVVHRQEVLRDMSTYRCEEMTVKADDGTLVPLSLVTRRDADAAGPRPCLLYGYGAYEASLDPELWHEMLPLLDRGFVLAVAHVRGGGEGGRTWWLQGRLTAKATTFTDFAACARHLVESGATSPGRLAARGGSAGGLLVAATMSLAPELFGAVVAEVPFVDVVNTMLDDTLPLTVAERDEWGDPRDPTDHAYLRSYSPYDNLPGPARPALLVTASRHDPRVSVHEPAKWVARLRADGDQGDRPLLLQTALGAAAHTGPAGRYDAWRHEAVLHAFVVDTVGADKASTVGGADKASTVGG